MARLAAFLPNLAALGLPRPSRPNKTAGLACLWIGLRRCLGKHAVFGAAQEMSCKFILSQRKVVVNRAKLLKLSSFLHCVFAGLFVTTPEQLTVHIITGRCDCRCKYQGHFRRNSARSRSVRTAGMSTGRPG